MSSTALVAQVHVPAHAYPVPRHSYPHQPPPHFYKPQPRFFPVPDESSFYLPQPDHTQPFQDSPREYPSDVARYPEPNELFAPRLMKAPEFEFQDAPYQQNMPLEPLQRLIQEFPPVPSHQLKMDFSPEKPSQEQPSVTEANADSLIEDEQVSVAPEESTTTDSEPLKEETNNVEPARPPTPPPMPKLAFDHFPAFRSSLDKPLSNDHCLLIQKELSSIYSLLLAAIDPKAEASSLDSADGERIKRLEASAAMIQEKPLTEFSPLNAHRALMNKVQTALQESSALSERLQNLTASYDYKFDMNFEL